MASTTRPSRPVQDPSSQRSRVAIVTGASRGFGLKLVQKLTVVRRSSRIARSNKMSLARYDVNTGMEVNDAG